MNNLGQRIRYLREDLDIEVKQLAGYVGVHPDTLTMWERGVRPVSVDNLVKICTALQVTPDYLLGYTTIKDAPGMLALALRETKP